MRVPVGLDLTRRSLSKTRMCLATASPLGKTQRVGTVCSPPPTLTTRSIPPNLPLSDTWL